MTVRKLYTWLQHDIGEPFGDSFEAGAVALGVFGKAKIVSRL
jgi:hypothetical protein